MTIKKKNAITGIWAVAVLLSALAFSTRAEPPQPVLTPPQQVGAPAVAGDQQPNSAAAKPAVGIDRWTYFRGNALSQGVANTTLPEKPVLLWKYEVPAGAFEVTAAIVDGVVYIGDLDGALVALNLTTGKVIWKTTIESGFVSSPAYLNGTFTSVTTTVSSTASTPKTAHLYGNMKPVPKSAHPQISTKTTCS